MRYRDDHDRLLHIRAWRRLNLPHQGQGKGIWKREDDIGESSCHLTDMKYNALHWNVKYVQKNEKWYILSLTYWIIIVFFLSTPAKEKNKDTSNTWRLQFFPFSLKFRCVIHRFYHSLLFLCSFLPTAYCKTGYILLNGKSNSGPSNKKDGTSAALLPFPLCSWLETRARDGLCWLWPRLIFSISFPTYRVLPSYFASASFSLWHIRVWSLDFPCYSADGNANCHETMRQCTWPGDFVWSLVHVARDGLFTCSLLIPIWRKKCYSPTFMSFLCRLCSSFPSLLFRLHTCMRAAMFK